jgi:Na+-driven multidrug efflux pump
VWPTIITITGIWLVQLPTAYLLSHEIGLEGVWLGYPVGFAAVLLAQAVYYGLIWRHPSRG